MEPARAKRKKCGTKRKNRFAAFALEPLHLPAALSQPSLKHGPYKAKSEAEELSSEGVRKYRALVKAVVTRIALQV